MRFKTTCSGLIFGSSLDDVTQFLQNQTFLHDQPERPATNVRYLKPEHIPARLSYWKLVGVLPWIDAPNTERHAPILPFMYVAELGINAVDAMAALTYVAGSQWLRPGVEMTCVAWTSPYLG